jgi:PAS domain S-box-containing protein
MLDVRTVMVTFCLSSLVLTLVMAGLWRQNRRQFDGIHLWVFLFGFQTAGYSMVALRGFIPTLFSVLVANTLLAVVPFLLLIGLERFVGRTGPRRYNYIMLAAFVGLFTYFTYVQPDVAVRIALISAVVMVLFAQCAWLLLRGVRPELQSLARLTAIVCILSVLARVWRLMITFSQEGLIDYMDASSLDTSVQLINLVLAIALAFALTLMVNRRAVQTIDDQARQMLESRVELEISQREAAQLQQAQQLLRTSEERFRTIMASMQDIVFTLDREQRHTGVYGPWVGKAGLTQEHFLGKTAIEVFGDEVGRVHRDANERALAGEFVIYDWSTTVGGQTLHYQTSLSPVVDVDGNVRGLVGVGRDTTSVKNAERELAASEQRYRSLFQCSLDAVSLVAADGTLIDASQSYLDLFGYATTDVGTKNVRAHYVNEAECDEYVRLLERDGVVTQHLTKLLRTDGTVMDCMRSSVANRDATGRIVSIQTWTKDVTESLRAEAALRENESRFRNFLEQAPVAIGVFNLAGLGEYANRAFLDVLGLRSLEEMVGRPAYEFFTPQFREQSRERTRRRLEGLPVPPEYESVALRTDGEEFPVRLAVAPIQLSDRTVSIAFLTDLTDQERSEAAMKRSEEKYRSLFEQSVDAILINAPDGSTIEANQALLDMLGYTREELGRMNGRDLYANPSDREEFLRKIERDDRVFDEVRYKRKDGTEFDCQRAIVALRDEDGRISVIQGLLRDVTERRRAQKRLQDSELRYRALFETANDAILLMSDGRFVECNGRALAVYGCSREQILGEIPARFSPPLQPDGEPSEAKALDMISRALATGPQFFEWEHCRADGTPFSAEVSLNRLDLDGKQMLQAIVRDVTEQRRAVKALRDSELRYRALFETAEDAILLFADGRWVDCNAGASKVFGCTREQIVGGHPNQFSPPTQPDGRPSEAEAVRLITLAFTTGPQSFEWEHCRADGTTFSAEVTLNRVDLGDKPHIQAIVRDVSERKKASAELEARERYLTTILQTTQDGYWVGDAEGRIVDANEAYCRMSGYNSDELRQLRISDLDAHEQPEETAAHMRRLVEQGFDIFETVHRRKDGSTFAVEISVTFLPLPIGQFVCFCRDITDRRRAEEDLRQTSASLEAMYHLVRTGIMIIDSETHCVVEANETAAEIMGLPRESVVGQRCFSLACSADEGRCPIKDLGQSIDNSERQIIRPDGHVKDVLKTARPFLFRGKECYLESFVDITERRQAELELEKYRDHLEELVRQRTAQAVQATKAAESANAAKSDFLASMSHELRTPLNAILGFSQVLQERYFGELNDRQLEYIGDILTSSRHLLSLINDILDLSKIEAGKTELELAPVRIGDLFKNSLGMIRERALQHGIAVEYKPHGLDDLEILVDERKTKQIVYNLLSNAVKFTPDGGTITLEARAVSDRLEVNVSDTGVGISRKDLARMFTKFYQVKGGIVDKTPGTGLGLSLSKGLVEMHGGTITARSKGPGQGSCFTFTLPLRHSGGAVSS